MNGQITHPVPKRELVAISPAEAMALLATVSLGRVVFTLSALPAIRPVNHMIDRGQIVVRTRLASAAASLIKPERDMVVAYEADAFDLEHHLGWSVVVTGYARSVTDPDTLARYAKELTPWVDLEMDSAITISPELVTGFRLVEVGAG